MLKFAFLAPALFLALLLVLSFGPALAEGRLLAPGDALAYYFPVRVLVAAAYRGGELPFWNPFGFAGMPLLAAIQGGVFYPGNLAFLVLPPALAMNVTVAGAYAVAGGATYALARALALPRVAALLAMTVFMGGGFMAAHLEHLTMIQAAGLMPALLWAVERYRQTSLAIYAAAGCVLLALQILAGHPQMVAFSLLLAGAYALHRGWDLPPRERRGYVAVWLAMAALGIGLALIQLWPSVDFIRISQRQAMPYEQLVSHSLPPRQLVTLLFPFLFGAFPSAWCPTPYWGAGPWYYELTGYVGVATLVLAGVAALGWQAEPRVRFWLATAAAGLALALGGFTPLYRIWAMIPVLNTMRVPGRHLVEVDLALALLAGFGLTLLVRLPAAEARRLATFALGFVALPLLLVGGGVALAGPAIAERLQPFMPAGVRLADALHLSQPALWSPFVLWAAAAVLLLACHRPGMSWAVLALVVGDVWLFGQHVGWRQTSPLASAFPVIAVAIAKPSHAGARSLSLAAGSYPYYDVERVGKLRLAGWAALLGERSVGGYDAFIPARYARLLGGMASGGQLGSLAIWEPRHHVLDLLGLDRIRLDPLLMSGPVGRAVARPGRFSRLPADQGAAMFANPRAMPRTWRPVRYSLLSEQAIDARLTVAAAFDPREEALLEEMPALGNALSAGSASAEAISLNRIKVITHGSGPGLVLVNEGYDTGWRARTGDVDLPVHRADGLILAVEVPAGRQEIELSYEPTSWRLGLAGSGASLLLLLGFLVWRPRTFRVSGASS